MEKLLEALLQSGLNLSLKIQEKDALKVSVVGKTINVDILDPEAIGRVLKESTKKKE